MDTDEETIESSVCICTRVCDCEAPDGLTPELEKICAPLSHYGLGNVVALCSNECPVHNSPPNPNQECEAKIHWFEYGYRDNLFVNTNQLTLSFD